MKGLKSDEAVRRQCCESVLLQLWLLSFLRGVHHSVLMKRIALLRNLISERKWVERRWRWGAELKLSERDSAERENTRLLCLIGPDFVLKHDIKSHLLLTRWQRQTVRRWRGREDKLEMKECAGREKREGNKYVLIKWIIRYSLKYYFHIARLLTNCMKLRQDCSLFWPRTFNLYKKFCLTNI